MFDFQETMTDVEKAAVSAFLHARIQLHRYNRNELPTFSGLKLTRDATKANLFHAMWKCQTGGSISELRDAKLFQAISEHLGDDQTIRDVLSEDDLWCMRLRVIFDEAQQ